MYLYLIMFFHSLRLLFSIELGARQNEKDFDVRIISFTNFNAQFSLFVNNMFVTLLSSTCFEH